MWQGLLELLDLGKSMVPFGRLELRASYAVRRPAAIQKQKAMQ
jgi:hypothetical protein